MSFCHDLHCHNSQVYPNTMPNSRSTLRVNEWSCKGLKVGYTVRIYRIDDVWLEKVKIISIEEVYTRESILQSDSFGGEAAWLEHPFYQRSANGMRRMSRLCGPGCEVSNKGTYLAWTSVIEIALDYQEASNISSVGKVLQNRKPTKQRNRFWEGGTLKAEQHQSKYGKNAYLIFSSSI